MRSRVALALLLMLGSIPPRAVAAPLSMLSDLWFFASANHPVSARRPTLDIEASDAPLLPRVTLDLNASSFLPGAAPVATFRLAPGPVGLLVDAYAVIEAPVGASSPFFRPGCSRPVLCPSPSGSHRWTPIGAVEEVLFIP